MDLLLLSVAWLSYFAIHSLLASLWMKQRVVFGWPDLMPTYRLISNFIALLLLIPPVALMHSLQGPMLWQWTGPAGWLSDGMALMELSEPGCRQATAAV